ncbi:MAG: beta-phosphoglucomutase family hydrolase [Actinomycetes bacterium]|nr:beta-phosphoglucomutase family hydrolase [Actinomycetes bacterium]MDX5381305.1 beta-phosphoglucomutase family hydrolase [Actinomycetes bacterium]MDX5400691.1 beta-phosphoglucomutase family hydrolase [Actinomycetes bacterium]MDX5451082.1 beta-phosphoglucomutase family hydrolase [Actinomycetes bacterium]
MDWTPYDAVLFDLDGVITPTAELHMRAWAEMFNAFLDSHGVEEPYTDDDYFAYVDGKPRYDGVRSFLQSRGIDLPEGDPSDPPEAETVCGLGNRKNDVFNAVLARDGIAAYPGSLRLLEVLAERGIKVAVVSSSKNAPTVLEAAGLADRFPVVVDGSVAADLALPGKPRPETFLHAAEEVGVPAGRAVVVEDAVSGVAAGRAGNFGLVVGVDRGAGEQTLLDSGADVVVADLEELA